jgi:hypothetical protein
MDAAGIIRSAVQALGRLGQGRGLSQSEKDDGLIVLNAMLDSWAARRLFAYEIAHASYAFGSSKQSYTIGPSGADFTAARPLRIERANLVIVGAEESRTPLQVINFDEYADIPIAGLSSGIPVKLYYRPTFPKGTLYPWPYPTDTANKLELFVWAQLSSFAALATEASLPPGYLEAVIYSLAEKLAPTYRLPISPDVERLARQARALISGVNSQSPKLATDIGVPTAAADSMRYRG